MVVAVAVAVALAVIIAVAVVTVFCKKLKRRFSRETEDIIEIQLSNLHVHAFATCYSTLCSLTRAVNTISVGLTSMRRGEIERDEKRNHNPFDGFDIDVNVDVDVDTVDFDVFHVVLDVSIFFIVKLMESLMLTLMSTLLLMVMMILIVMVMILFYGQRCFPTDDDFEIQTVTPGVPPANFFLSLTVHRDLLESGRRRCSCVMTFSLSSPTN